LSEEVEKKREAEATERGGGKDLSYGDYEEGKEGE